jgi:DNA modification methylase
VLAAHALKLSEIPTITLVGLSETQRRAYVIADNKLALNAGWNLELLTVELEALREDGFDTSLLGFSEAELEQMGKDLLGAEPEREVEEDEAPDPPKVPITKPGDVWRLGRHRLVCGDSTRPEVWAALMPPEERFDLVFTDPPYGVDYEGKTADALPVHNDGSAGLPKLLDQVFSALVEHSRPGASWYVFGPDGPRQQPFTNALAARGIWRQSLVWIKNSLVMGGSDFHYQHEQIFYGWVPGAAHRPPPDRKQSTTWHFDRPTRSEQHPTMKPVKLVAHALELSSRKGELVGDPFGGSGTTLIAAEQLERTCRMVEFGPEYCDVIVERWQNLSGQTATRSSG